MDAAPFTYPQKGVIDMDMEKRMAGDYEITQALRIGDKEIVLGRNRAAQPGQEFLCAFYESNAILGMYSDCIVSDDYVEIVELFTSRITEQAQKLRAEQEKSSPAIQADQCDPVDYRDCIEGKVIVIKPEVLRQEYRYANHQLKLCVGGFGSQGNARGSACYCVDLSSGKESRFERRDVMGTMEPDKLPQWAKDGLKQALAGRGKKYAEKEAR